MQTFKQFFTEATTPSVLYHVTRASNADGILKNGLEPRVVKVSGLKTRTPRIYLFSNINSENIDMIELFQHEIKSIGGFMQSRVTIPPKQYEDVSVFKVVIPKGIKLYKDPLVNAYATNAYFVTNQSIGPQYLELVYTGPIKGSKEKSLKSFVKSHGIEGDPYSTGVIIDKSKQQDFNDKLRQLQIQAGNKETKAKVGNDYITTWSLKELEKLEFWRSRVDTFNTDNMFTHGELLYEGNDGYMTSDFYAEGRARPLDYSLGVTKKELVQLLVKEFNGIVVHSDGELKEAYNELVTKMRRSDLTYE